MSNFIPSELLQSLQTPDAKAAIEAFAGHFSSYPLTVDNAPIFQRILRYNYGKAVDRILKHKDPAGFFSSLTPSKDLIRFSISTLTDYRVGELYEPVALTCLGILQNAYANPAYGISIYALSNMDLYHTAKYLKSDNDEVNVMIIGFLENLCSLSDSEGIHTLSRKIIDALNDNRKKLEDVIPPAILS